MADSDEPLPTFVRNAATLQRLKLEKLMKNPEKPIIIPERQQDRKQPHVPDFVRNVMGSSAGAGSGEFHVYRHLRRKEYARQKYIKEKSDRALKDDEYQQKLEENRKLAEERTAKKRAKRLKKKENLKKKKLMQKNNPQSGTKEEEESDLSESDDEASGNEKPSDSSNNKENSEQKTDDNGVQNQQVSEDL